MSPPIFYSFRRCPYAMRARLALAASGQLVELREIVLRNKPKAMIEASPKATVPVLILSNGTIIDESLDIMHWALSQSDPDHWLPKDALLREEIDAAIAHNDGPFKQLLDRYKYPEKSGLDAHQRNLVRAQASETLMDYERRLEQRPWLLSDVATLADFAVLPFVRQFAHVDQDWFYQQDWPQLIAWLDRFKSSALFERIMYKYPAWAEGDTPTYFANP